MQYKVGDYIYPQAIARHNHITTEDATKFLDSLVGTEVKKVFQYHCSDCMENEEYDEKREDLVYCPRCDAKFVLKTLYAKI